MSCINIDRIVPKHSAAVSIDSTTVIATSQHLYADMYYGSAPAVFTTIGNTQEAYITLNNGICSLNLGPCNIVNNSSSGRYVSCQIVPADMAPSSPVTFLRVGTTGVKYIMVPMTVSTAGVLYYDTSIDTSGDASHFFTSAMVQWKK
jgi:hypothetical protein